MSGGASAVRQESNVRIRLAQAPAGQRAPSEATKAGRHLRIRQESNIRIRLTQAPAGKNPPSHIGGRGYQSRL